MAKPTPTKEEQTLIYQLAQDMAKLGFEIEGLKNKTVKAVRIVVPAKPEKYQQYELKAVINLPPECQHAICIKSQNGNVGLIETGETMSVDAETTASEFYLAPVYRLDAETINATLDQEEMSNIDAAQERAERELKEQQEQQERAERDKAIYKYLAKYLTDNWLETVRASSYIDWVAKQGVTAQVNQQGLQEMLAVPFERNTNISLRNIDPDVYADAKSAMLKELERIQKGEVDLSTAKDFNVIKYDYLDLI